jgi:putative DNA primase/helicase
MNADDAAAKPEVTPTETVPETVQPEAATGMYTPVLVRLADVKPEPVRWLWPGRIALGKLTLIAGDPGLGKSFITLDIAARVSCGAPWPDAQQTPAPVSSVVLLSAEDDLADTIRPRLDAAGADVSRIVELQAVRTVNAHTGGDRCTPFCLATDLQALEEAIRGTPGCRLVVIDPISAYLPVGGRFDSHRNSDVRAVLAPLAILAARHGIAVIAVTHLRKSEGPAVYRTMGSLGFVVAARAVWVVARDKHDATGQRRLLLPAKNNIGGDQMGLAFALGDAGDAIPRVVWEPEPVNVPVDDALTAGTGRNHQDDGDDAADFLREALADSEQPAADILKQGCANGFTQKAVRKAFRALGGRRRRVGFGSGGAWYWSLPGAIVASIGAIDAQPTGRGKNGNNEAATEGRNSKANGEPTEPGTWRPGGGAAR